MIEGQKEEYLIDRLRRIVLKDSSSIEEFTKKLNLTSFLKMKKEEMKINLFQIEKMKLNSIHVNKNEYKNNENSFVDIFQNFQNNEGEIVDLIVEIELYPFGKRNFKPEENFGKEFKIRLFDQKGNIVVVNKIFLNKNKQIENGEIEIFNEKNENLWKGEIKNGRKCRGIGFFEYTDKNNILWECKGKNFNFEKKSFSFNLIFFYKVE